MRRFFTPEEATQELAEARPLFELAVERQKRLVRLVEGARSASPLETAMVMPEVERLRTEIRQLVQKITARGIEVKGLDSGLLDFPALRNGRPVYLCWQMGEERIEWWHPKSTGFAGRQRVDRAPGTTWEWCN